jgi:hypothetical protein
MDYRRKSLKNARKLKNKSKITKNGGFKNN